MKAITFLWLLLVVCGCQGYSVTGGPGKTVTPSLQTGISQPRDLLHINSLLVLPVHLNPRVRLLEEREGVSAELERVVRSELSLELLFLEQQLEQQLQVGEAATQEWALQQGRKLGADGVLVTRLLDYVERVGSAVGASQPARVDFAMAIYRVSDGREVWKATYYFQDQALTENLFRARKRSETESKRGGWLQAREVVASGFRQACRDFASRRVEAFSTENGLS